MALPSRVARRRRCVRAPCRMAQSRSVNKKKSVFSSTAVCSPEPWGAFERRVTPDLTGIEKR
eukprot:6461578-Prymnesium_polylepis.1